MKITILTVILGALLMPPTGICQEASAARALARELAGSRIAPETIERLAARISRLVATEGDEVLDLLRRAGPRALRLLEAADESPAALRLLLRQGDQAAALIRRPAALRLVEQHGDPAATVLLRHPAAGESVLGRQGSSALPALDQLSGRQARRLAILAEDGGLDRLGRPRELMSVVGRLGDRAMEFIWRHKGALAVAGVMAAFLDNPEPFINGTRDLAAVAVEPARTAAGEFAREAGARNGWLIIILSILVAIVVCFKLGGGFRHSRSPSRSKQQPSRSVTTNSTEPDAPSN